MKTYIIKNEAAYSNTWLAPYVGFSIALFKQKGRIYFSLNGRIDKSNGYFTKRKIADLLQPFNHSVNSTAVK